jgi:hypothetical protein
MEADELLFILVQRGIKFAGASCRGITGLSNLLPQPLVDASFDGVSLQISLCSNLAHREVKSVRLEIGCGQCLQVIESQWN